MKLKDSSLLQVMTTIFITTTLLYLTIMVYEPLYHWREFTTALVYLTGLIFVLIGISTKNRKIKGGIIMILMGVFLIFLPSLIKSCLFAGCANVSEIPTLVDLPPVSVDK